MSFEPRHFSSRWSGLCRCVLAYRLVGRQLCSLGMSLAWSGFLLFATLPPRLAGLSFPLTFFAWSADGESGWAFFFQNRKN
ncbi:unnamed protein product [Amoebophrya sp. A120]|nr:unnamed protein product [Amoebophrya sp. A120]|eukprot:GSA120T00001065001.1